MIGSRLSDPNKIISSASKLQSLQEKISSCMTRMFRKPVNGGNPFLFTISAAKPHEIANTHGLQKIETAATDGKKFYWNPDFLDSLNPDELAIVMEHEVYHVIFFHVKRGRGKSGNVWSIAIDYVANACILSDIEKTQRKQQKFGGNIGEPLLFKDLLAFIDGTQEMPEGAHCYADLSLFGRSPESIYSEILDHWNNSPRKCKTCGNLTKPLPGQSQSQSQGGSQKGQGQGQKGQGGCGHDHGMECPECGSSLDGLGSMDSHIECELNSQQVQAELMKAAEQCRAAGRGTVPGSVEGVLGELMTPEIKFTDIVRNAMMKKVQDVGLNNDWKRLRKRFLNTTPKQFLPRRYTHRPRWIAAIDTSGSMSDNDVMFAVSQIQVLGNNTDGIIVPMDASTKWDCAGKITSASASELRKHFKLTGRGGTDFTDFFAHYREHFGSDFDVIVILTDGDCGVVPKQLRPPNNTAVVWVLTKSNPGFNQPFGRTVPFRTEKL